MVRLAPVAAVIAAPASASGAVVTVTLVPANLALTASVTVILYGGLPPYQSRVMLLARGPTTAMLVSPSFASGSLLFAFFSSTTVLRVTSSAVCFAAGWAHGVSVPEDPLARDAVGRIQIADAEADAQVAAQRRVHVRDGHQALRVRAA